MELKASVTSEELRHGLKYISSDSTDSIGLKDSPPQPNEAGPSRKGVFPHANCVTDQPAHQFYETDTSLGESSHNCLQGHLVERETVFIVSPNILFAEMVVNGSNISVLIDTGASVSLVNEEMVPKDDICP